MADEKIDKAINKHSYKEKNDNMYEYKNKDVVFNEGEYKPIGNTHHAKKQSKASTKHDNLERHNNSNLISPNSPPNNYNDSQEKYNMNEIVPKKLRVSSSMSGSKFDGIPKD